MADQNIRTSLRVVHIFLLIFAACFAFLVSVWMWLTVAWLAYWLALDFWEDYRTNKAWQKLHMVRRQ